MNNFIAYLENGFDLIFIQGAYNNLHRDLYGVSAAAIKMEADTLSISSTHVIVSKKGIPVREWDLSGWEGMSQSFRRGLQTILRHDERVRAHIQLTVDSPEVVTYQFHA